MCPNSRDGDLKRGSLAEIKKKKSFSPSLDKDVGAEDVSTHSSSNYRRQRVKKRSILSLFLKVVFLADLLNKKKISQDITKHKTGCVLWAALDNSAKASCFLSVQRLPKHNGKYMK